MNMRIKSHDLVAGVPMLCEAAHKGHRERAQEEDKDKISEQLGMERNCKSL